MITLKKLAQELNVSVSTVSKALHDNSEISQNTIDKVKDLAVLRNYIPNQAAINLKRRKTKTIGVIVPDILNHFFAKVLHGIEKQASKQGYSIITCISNELYEKEKRSLELLSNGSVDGFILSVAEETQTKNKTDHFTKAFHDKLPILMFDRVINSISCDKIIVDDFNSAFEATNYLFNEGRKHIALINGIKELCVGKLRAQGYKNAVEQAKLYKNKPLIFNIDNIENIEIEIETFLKTNPTIDGIVAIDNTSGVIALNKALKLKKKIPKDISIIGFSDDNVLKFTNPKLSTIAQHPIKIGVASVKLIIDRIENETSVSKTTKMIKTELVLRETTM